MEPCAAIWLFLAWLLRPSTEERTLSELLKKETEGAEEGEGEGKGDVGGRETD